MKHQTLRRSLRKRETRVELRTTRFVLAALLILISAGTVTVVLFGTILDATTNRYHSGLLKQQFEGVFRERVVDDSWVFYLETDRGLVRLVFYCGGSIQTAASFKGEGDMFVITQISKNILVKQYSSYCVVPNEIPIQPGTSISVTGTLIKPSMLSNPALQFIGDLYVFKYCVRDVCVAT